MSSSFMFGGTPCPEMERRQDEFARNEKEQLMNKNKQLLEEIAQLKGTIQDKDQLLEENKETIRAMERDQLLKEIALLKEINECNKRRRTSSP
jgi:hypothetical protein